MSTNSRFLLLACSLARLQGLSIHSLIQQSIHLAIRMDCNLKLCMKINSPRFKPHSITHSPSMPLFLDYFIIFIFIFIVVVVLNLIIYQQPTDHTRLAIEATRVEGPSERERDRKSKRDLNLGRWRDPAGQGQARPGGSLP